MIIFVAFTWGCTSLLPLYSQERVGRCFCNKWCRYAWFTFTNLVYSDPYLGVLIWLYSPNEGLKGPRKFEWKKCLHGFLRGMWWIVFHGLPGFVPSLPPRGGSNTKWGNHDTLNSRNPWFTIYCCVEGPTWRGWWKWNSILSRSWLRMPLQYTWRPVTTQNAV